MAIDLLIKTKKHEPRCIPLATFLFRDDWRAFPCRFSAGVLGRFRHNAKKNNISTSTLSHGFKYMRPQSVMYRVDDSTVETLVAARRGITNGGVGV